MSASLSRMRLTIISELKFGRCIMRSMACWRLGEVARHAVEQNNCENDIVFDFPHGSDTMGIASHFSQRVAQRGVVVQTDFKGLH
jgi:hypothetical protein